MGVTKLGLTPDFLDGDENIIAGHRTTCNAKAELNRPGFTGDSIL
ncbi:MAG: hypothetical protein ACYSTO_12265 [Planctomycetota bacterium]|jgi:hypothetical protein